MSNETQIMVDPTMSCPVELTGEEVMYAIQALENENHKMPIIKGLVLIHKLRGLLLPSTASTSSADDATSTE